jgi:hypothetical protein
MVQRDIIAQILEYKDRRLSPDEIAHRLGMQVLEVISILNVQKKLTVN